MRTEEVIPGQEMPNDGQWHKIKNVHGWCLRKNAVSAVVWNENPKSVRAEYRFSVVAKDGTTPPSVGSMFSAAKVKAHCVSLIQGKYRREMNADEPAQTSV